MSIGPHTTYGVTGDKWGTVDRIEPTGLLPIKMPDGEVVEPFIYHVKWDHAPLNEIGYPLNGNMLESKSAVERLGEISDDE